MLPGITVLADRFANPAHALLLVTGLLMVFVGRLSLTIVWIAAARVLYVAAVVLGLAFTPRPCAYGIANIVPGVLILFLRVVKPDPF